MKSKPILTHTNPPGVYITDEVSPGLWKVATVYFARDNQTIKQYLLQRYYKETVMELFEQEKTLPTRDEMIEMLKAGECQVTFTKVNGEKRVMTCTLNEQILSMNVFVQTETTKPKKVNEDVLPVYDVNAKGWRSFRIDSVEDFTTTIG